MPPDELEAVFREKPALHRYPGSMAQAHRTRCASTSSTSTTATRPRSGRGADDPQVLFDRIRALPGYGEEKAKIFLAILGKRLRVAPQGWEEYAVPFADDEPALGRRHRLARGPRSACARGSRRRRPRARARPTDVFLLVIALARGIAALVALMAERRRHDPPRHDPPPGPRGDDLILAA